MNALMGAALALYFVSLLPWFVKDSQEDARAGVGAGARAALNRTLNHG